MILLLLGAKVAYFSEHLESLVRADVNNEIYNR